MLPGNTVLMTIELCVPVVKWQLFPKRGRLLEMWLVFGINGYIAWPSLSGQIKRTLDGQPKDASRSKLICLAIFEANKPDSFLIFFTQFGVQLSPYKRPSY